MPLIFRRFAALVLLALLAAFMPQAQPARAATTIHVTNTNDSGAGSLRAALTAALNGDTIVFDNGGALWTIQPSTPLPELDKGGVTIDGGAGHKVVLDGSLITNDPTYNIATANGLTISSSNNTIKGLVIVKFFRGPGLGETAGGAGIRIIGTSPTVVATGNKIIGGWIGVAANGTAAGNSNYGVLIDDHVTNTTIGGTAVGEGNVISGNGTIAGGGANVAMFQALFNSANPGPISGNKLIGNYIGTTTDGLAAIGGGNPRDGILLGDWAQNNTIGGATAAERNVIAGHNYSSAFIFGTGVSISPQPSRPGSGNVVAGNYIGVDKNGTAAIPNAIGIQINGGASTTIGGATATARNLIAGNSKSGVVAQSPGTNNNTIANNWIGLNASGSALGNSNQGVLVQTSATGTIIGPGNVISANGAEGVWLNTGGNTVKGNIIGASQDGLLSDATFSNGQPSVRIDAGAGNTIGGTTPADRNVIALSKQLVGIDISGTATGSLVYGNYLGVNASGGTVFTGSSPDGSTNIRIGASSTGNQIGGSAAGSGNIIGGAYAGIKIESTSGNLIKNNSVGVGAGGQNIGNRFYGIWLVGTTGNTIGGTLGSEGNLVANSGLYGIYADGSGSSNNTLAGNTVRDNGADGVRVRIATGVKITQTQTSANGGAGIGLGSGGNATLAAPSGLQFSTPGGVPTLSGTACSGCVVEVFTSATRDDGEGPHYLTSTTASGTNFSVGVSGCDQFLTATARDGSNNTSPFTTLMLDAGTGCVAPQPNVQLDAASPAAKTVAPGATATYTHTLHNTGTAAGAFSITKSSTQGGWTVQVSPTSVSLAAGATATITVSVTPPANAPAGAADQTTITATVGNKSAQRTDTTTVQQIYAVDIAPNRSGQVTPPGSIDYTHIITNTGNGSDTFSLTETHTNPGVTVTFPDGASCTLAAGASCTRRARVSAAAGASGADTTTVKATSQGNSSVFDQVQDTTTVASAAIPTITSSPPQSILPGNTATFVHTVTNVGNITGQFTVTLLNAAPTGWTFLYTPTASFSLAPSASAAVTVTITAQSGASAPGAGSSATAQVQVGSSDNALATTSDTATALLRPAFSFSPATQPTFNNAQPGQTAIFTHTLTNLGNGTDTFTVTVAPPGGWAADPIGPITLARDASQTVTVRMHVPIGQAAGSYPFDATAQTTSTPKPAPQARTDTVVVIGAAVPQLSPGQTQSALILPTLLTFTHTLTNTGNQTGTFSLAAAVQGAPAGWSATANPPSCDLAQGATCMVTVAVSIPPGAIAGPQGVSLTASITGPPAASDSVTDIVNVPAIPGLLFAPDYPNGSGDPETVVTYTHTLTNTGNGTDSYTLTIQTTPGWSATVSPTIAASVPRGGVRTIAVAVRVPGGIAAGGTGAVTATATSAHAPFPSAIVIDSTTINAKPGAALIPDQQSLSANPTSTQPDTVTFIHMLRNTGSVSTTYTLTRSNSLGWVSTLTPTTVGPLDPGQSVPVTLTVTAPAGTPFGSPPNVTTITAAATNNPVVPLATAHDTTLIGPQFSALLTPPINRSSALPGATVAYTHTLKNTGATTDTFVLTTIAPNGWDTRPAPSSIVLARNASTTITVTVRVPTSALSGTLDMATLRAQSLTDSAAFGTAQEHTTVLQVVGLSLSPSRFNAANPGHLLTYQHTLVNTGNGTDTFLLTATLSSTSAIVFQIMFWTRQPTAVRQSFVQSPNLFLNVYSSWPVTITPASIGLLSGGAYPGVQVQVRVPNTIPPNIQARIIVTATSRSDPSISGQVIDTIGSPGQFSNVYLLRLPVIARGQSIPALSLRGTPAAPRAAPKEDHGAGAAWPSRRQ